MSVSIRAPDQPYQKAVEIANSQNTSADEIFVSAFAEQLSAWEHLQQWAARGSREKFLAALEQARDLEPDETDQRRPFLSSESTRPPSQPALSPCRAKSCHHPKVCRS